MATCFLTANGIKVTVEDSKCMQANAFIQAGLFEEYHCQKNSAIFKINLAILMVIYYILFYLIMQVNNNQVKNKCCECQYACACARTGTIFSMHVECRILYSAKC